MLKDLNLSKRPRSSKVVKVTTDRGLGEAARTARPWTGFDPRSWPPSPVRKYGGDPAQKAIAPSRSREALPTENTWPSPFGGQRMYAFLGAHLINLALPRIGISVASAPKLRRAEADIPPSGCGQIIFPEILPYERSTPSAARYGHPPS